MGALLSRRHTAALLRQLMMEQRDAHVIRESTNGTTTLFAALRFAAIAPSNFGSSSMRSTRRCPRSWTSIEARPQPWQQHNA